MIISSKKHTFVILDVDKLIDISYVVFLLL